MPPWHQVAHAIAIPSGMISLCTSATSTQGNYATRDSKYTYGTTSSGAIGIFASKNQVGIL